MMLPNWGYNAACSQLWHSYPCCALVATDAYLQKAVHGQLAQLPLACQASQRMPMAFVACQAR